MSVRNLFSRSLVIASIGAFIGVIGNAYADAPASKWYDSIGLSGYLQTSYVGNLNRPHDLDGHKIGNTGRQYDTDSNGFSMNAFLLQIAKPVGDSDHYGFTVRLRTGQDTGSMAAQEAYLTYAPISKLSVTGGKFVTSEGYEVVDSVSNPNFSLGLLFTFAEPIAHTGLKANYAFSDKVNATLGVVNGWDVAPDNNTAKTLLFQVATTPTKQIGWSFQGLYGKELADPSHSQRLSLDTVATFAPIDKLSLAVQGNWGQQTNDPNTAASQGASHWMGAGLWASFVETTKTTSTLRFEVLRDQNNANRFNPVFPGTGFPTTFADGTTNQTVKEITFTQKYMLTSAMGVRGEFRHDWSNQAYFVKHDGTSVRNQNTISADWFVTF